MGKRSNFDRNPRDYYPTPYEAVVPLLPWLPIHPFSYNRFIEPCAGDGRLIKHLEKHGMNCVGAYDIEPKAKGIEKKDALFFGDLKLPQTDLIITNPPWERAALHMMIDTFRRHAPTWLLFDSDWMFTAQAKPYLEFCELIVSVGRISWMGNGVAGMDNCCWYKFIDHEIGTIFKP